jgi:hypothetical protein
MTKHLRRAFLLGTGGVTLALPFLPSFGARSGHGVLSQIVAGRARADATAPKRIVLWFGPWGATPDAWSPRNVSDDGRRYDLGYVMEPLAAHRERMTILEGINMASVHRQMGRAGNHTIGSANVLSAAGLREHVDGSGQRLTVPAGPTIDQVVARRLGAPTRFPFLALGDTTDHPDQFLQNEEGNDPGMISWPRELYDQCFADFATDGDARQRLALSRRSVLDAVLPGYAHLASRVSPDDRHVLDAHLDALRELERRLETPADCSAPPVPMQHSWDAASDRNYWSDPQGPYEPLLDLAARALVCDLTRVMTIRFDGSRAQVRTVVERFDEIGATSTGAAHEFSHCGWNDPANLEVWKEVQRWRFGHMATFLDKLAAATDVDGRSVLDNTVVVHVSEVLTGLHDGMPLQEYGYSNPLDTSVPMRPKGLPIFYVGGCGGALVTGRALDLSTTHTYADGLGKYAHGELYLTLARAMGVELDTFGMPEVCTRPIDEILAGG